MRMRHLKGRFSAVLMAILFVFCFSSTASVSAASNVFQIQNVTLETADGSIIDFSEEDISSDVTLGIVGDFVKYTITIKNTDDEAHIIKNITDDNTSPFITYEYDTHAGEEIESGSNLVLVVTAKYVAYITDINDSVQAENIKFLIQFEDLEEELLVPNTGNFIIEEAAVKNADASIAVPLVWLTAVILLAKHSKRAKFIVAVTAITLAASATSYAKADTVKTNDFTLNINFTLKLGRIIHYDGNWEDDGEMEDEHLVTGGTLTPNAFTALGYHFAGWSLEADDRTGSRRR